MIRVWSGRHGVVAIVIVAVTAVWRGLLLKASYFNQDDYYLTSRAFHRPSPDRHFLFEAVAGHVQPAQQLSYWLVAHHAPFDWGRVAVAILVVELLAVVVMWHLLSRLLPGRWVRVPLLAVFAWTPITLVPTLWWSAAMGLWPPMLFLLLAVLFFVRATQRSGGQALELAACVGAVVLGLAWHERGILAVAVLAGVALARSPRSGWRRVPDAVTRWWVLWVPLAAITVGYLLLHRALTSVESQQATIGDRVDIVTAFVFRNTIPGLASGPWQTDTLGGAVVPARWVVLVTGLLAAVAVVVVLRRGGPARWVALLMIAAYVAGDVLLLLLGRAGFGEIIGLDPRYTADVVGAAVLFLAIALEGPPRRTWRRPATGPALALAMTVLYLIGSAVTTSHLAPTYENRDDRRFVTTLRAGLARDPEQVLVDREAPATIVLPLLGKEALLSAVLAPLPEHPVFDLPSAKLRAVTDEGRLVEVRFVPVATSGPGPDGACGYAVRTTAAVPLRFSAPLSGRVVVHLELYVDRAADFEVGIGSWTGTVHVVRGPQEIWLVVPADAGGFSSVRFTGSGSATLCVVSAAVGPPVVEP